MEEKSFFLVQQSGKPAEHYTVKFGDRTYAEEAIKHRYYRNDAWDVKKRDQDFGKVKVGDCIIAYYTGDVEQGPRQILFIYEVSGLENLPKQEIEKAASEGRISPNEVNQLKRNHHVLRLKVHRKLKRGMELSLVRRWVEDGKLSPNMNKCGGLGFNICEVSRQDYEAIVEWDKEQPEVVTVEHMEEDLRTFIVGKPLEQTLGTEYSDFKLYEDAEGKTGELYNIPIGQIDILYQNRKTGDFLVVELKRTKDTPDSVAGQIARYLGWVKENLAKENTVYGILVAQSASEQLRYAVKSLKNCKFASYEVAFNLTLH